MRAASYTDNIIYKTLFLESVNDNKYDENNKNNKYKNDEKDDNYDKNNEDYEDDKDINNDKNNN